MAASNQSLLIPWRSPWSRQLMTELHTGAQVPRILHQVIEMSARMAQSYSLSHSGAHMAGTTTRHLHPQHNLKAV